VTLSDLNEGHKGKVGGGIIDMDIKDLGTAVKKGSGEFAGGSGREFHFGSKAQYEWDLGAKAKFQEFLQTTGLRQRLRERRDERQKKDRT